MYDTRIKIVKAAVATDAAGYRKENYIDIYCCWASVNNLYGKEFYNSYAVGLENILNCKVRYCNLLKEIFLNISDAERKQYRIIWNDTIYNILQVDFLNLNKKDIIFKLQNKV